MGVYIRLLHGRHDPNEEMHDWGFGGPVLGPFDAVHFTYMTDISCILDTGETLALRFTDDLLTWEGKYYGDFEITSTG
jgi:hypothetical protein